LTEPPNTRLIEPHFTHYHLSPKPSSKREPHRDKPHTMSATPQPTGATPPPPPPPPQQSELSQQPQATPQPPSEADGDGHQDPESPPLPPVPVPAVVVPGPRAARLQQLFASTLHHTLDKVVRGDNFGACFPTVAARAPGTLEFVQRQMVDRLRGLCEVCILFFVFFLFLVGMGVSGRRGTRSHDMSLITDSQETTCS
jgi:hypothetical protein